MNQTIRHEPASAPNKTKPYSLNNSDGSVADWFTSHEEAVTAMRKTSGANKMYSESEDYGFAITPVVGFEFADDGVWIEALQAKDYHTEKYGTVPVTVAKLNNLAASVKSNIRGIQLSTDYNHGNDIAKGTKASGTVKDAKVDGDKLFLNVEFTNTAKKEIADGEWKYFSSDWLDSYTHDDGSKHTDVLLGGGLTNTPIAKGLNPLPVNFSEIFTEKPGFEFATLTAAQRNALPDSKFLYIEKDGTKHLPVPDDAHVRAAITRLSQKGTGTVAGESWLTDSLRSSLLSKARAMLSNKKMSEDNMNEALRKLAEQLGISFQFSDAAGVPTEAETKDLENKVFAELTKVQTEHKALTEEVKPFRDLKVATDTQKSFSEQFPEQARQMEEDRKFRLEAGSRTFSETIGNKRFSETVGKKDAEGNDVVLVTTKGLSGLALEKIQDTHLKFSEGTVTVDDFAKVVNTIMDGGIVDYGEKGTSAGGTQFSGNDDAPVVGGEVLERRTAFAEKVLEVQNEKEGRTFAEALPLAATKYPKLYEDYRTANK